MQPLHEHSRAPELLALATTILGLAVALWLISGSDGFYHDDDASHYEFAIDGWTDSASLWHAWARPGLTLPLAVVGHWFGLVGCRVFSALATAATAYLSYRIARKILDAVPGGAYAAALAPALVWLQPLTMTLALTTLTETPAALYLTLGVWLYMRGNRIPGCLAISLAFITRYEILTLGPLLFGVIGYDALRRHQWKVASALKSPGLWACGISLLAGPIAYAAVALMLGLPPVVSPIYMFRGGATPVPQLGIGGWSHFLVNWMLAAGRGVLALWTVGAVCCARRAFFPAMLCLGLVGVETLLYRYGLFASGGYARFLVPIGGLTGAVAAAGLATLCQGRKVGMVIAFAVLGAIPLAGLYLDPDLLASALNRLGDGLHQALGLSLPTASLMDARDLAQGWALILAAAAVLAVGARSRILRLVLAVLAITIAATFSGLYALSEVRPLTISASTMHVLLRQTVRQVEALSEAGNPGITCHVVIPLMREHTRVILRPEAAQAAWRDSAPGTLFFWNSKYCGPATPDSPQGPLHAALVQHGRLVARVSDDTDSVEVYAKTPGPSDLNASNP